MGRNYSKNDNVRKRWICNFDKSEEPLYRMAIIEFRDDRVYIDKNAYWRDGHKDDSMSALKTIGRVELTEFWKIVHRLQKEIICCPSCGLAIFRDRITLNNPDMYERVKIMNREEMEQFVYWVYMCGNKDGRADCCDSSGGGSFFGGHMLTMPVHEIMPNNKIDDLWNRFENTYNKQTE